jgi:hypothetical protein
MPFLRRPVRSAAAETGARPKTEAFVCDHLRQVYERVTNFPRYSHPTVLVAHRGGPCGLILQVFAQLLQLLALLFGQLLGLGAKQLALERLELGLGLGREPGGERVSELQFSVFWPANGEDEN